MKKIMIAIVMLAMLASASVALELTGGSGIEMFKVENGSILYTPFINCEYEVNDHFVLKGMFTENFSVLRGQSMLIPNHHSFRYTLGAEWTPAKHLTVGFSWDNRWLIQGHDNVFVEEFSGNRNYLRIYYKW